VLRIYLEIPPTGVPRDIGDSHLYQDPEIVNRNVPFYTRKQVSVKHRIFIYDKLNYFVLTQ